MAQIQSGATADLLTVDPISKAARTALYDQNGNPIYKLHSGQYVSTDLFVPLAGMAEQQYRAMEVDRNGGQRVAVGVPIVTLQLYTAAVPPMWTTASAVSHTNTVNTTTGILLNASAIGTANTYANLSSFPSCVKSSNSRVHFKSRLRLIKGGANGQADWGLTGAKVPAGALHANACVFLYGTDGTLKPTVYMNSTVVVQGTDFASSITGNPSQYYTWEIILSNESVTFLCIDPTTGTIVNEQVLKINAQDPRFGMIPSWHLNFRTFVLASANLGLATQLYVADASAEILDVGSPKPWADIQAGNGFSAFSDPTVVLGQLANYANNAAPASATLSNTAAGYTTLGGQFQFAAVANAETDYALFAYTVPNNVRLHVTDINIDTNVNVVAIPAQETGFQWFVGEAAAVTLATNSFRRPIGMQTFPASSPIGFQAQTIRHEFRTPIVVQPQRVFHVGFKQPRGANTATQIYRGIVGIGGYFE